MLFNSLEFAFFLPLVFFAYWVMNDRYWKCQNGLLLLVSYYFYACWDWRFLFLLIFSTVLDYFTGLKMHSAQNKKTKKFWFWLSIIINVGFLGIFKYYNFFASSFADLISVFGFEANLFTLQVVLPVGISFYTFHGLSYVIDIYNEKMEPEKNIIDYSLFVSYFPLLVAGPIERATHLLPQIKKRRFFNYKMAVDGLRQILWGLFKKVVIADNCAEYANLMFGSTNDYNGSSLFLGAILFAFQIYGDFSGYSDIALGTSKLFGIELLKNFNFPYFSRNIAEFWRRWHISLSTWFRDYLYIPLGGSKGSLYSKIRNVMIIFIVSGFWHGANWTFIIWGLINAIFIIPSIVLKTNRNHLDIVAKNKVLPGFFELIQMGFTFLITTFAWIFFRADNVKHAFSYIGGICTSSLFEKPVKFPSLWLCLFLLFFIIIEWNGRQSDFAIQRVGFNWNRKFRMSFYMLLVLIIFLFSEKEQQFIYFQF
ncbi:MBOAT family O-acyltransferase [Flavobacterium sp.]|uniref:MBOAT family O-acyltransferase n=1 Tax=Flavobacterium sp. TaxID=239 RepID=UPI003D6B4809